MKHVADFHKIYKYQLDEDVVLSTDVLGYAADITSRDGRHRWVRLEPDGTLHVCADYSWDGASGPTVDTADSMVPSLAHDALYQLICLGALPMKTRRSADTTFRRLLQENGMSFVRRNLWYTAVRWFGRLFV